MYWTITVLTIELLGIAAAIHALFSVRTDRGTIAWCLALVTLPVVALPFYVVFGRTRFDSYRRAIRNALREHEDFVVATREKVEAFRADHGDRPDSPEAVLERLSPYCFTTGNRTRLLIDGAATFDAIFAAIRGAERSVLVQFYTINDDDLGRCLRDLLIDRAGRGVEVLVLYDEIGSTELPESYAAALRDGGVRVAQFGTRSRRSSRFEVNFRNHRKIVVVDGRIAFVGGHNVGDEYLGKADWAGHWRDTHLAVEGPAVIDCQMVFLGDWFWAEGDVPGLPWEPRSAIDGDGDGERLLILPSGPAQTIAVCAMAFIALINSARQRCWIASPYFVPDEAVLAALKLAALRGVDVRIMIPSVRDHWLVWLAAFSFLEEMEEAGVKMLNYTDGFLHQKTFLIDERLAGVGTANLDQRSFRLNFEVTAVAAGGPLIDEMEQMFENDFAHCRPAPGSDYGDRSVWFRLAVRVARLFAPVL